MTRVWGLESSWQGHYGPRVQVERARKELEITGCHRLGKEVGEAEMHRLQLSEKNTKGPSLRS